MKRMVRYRRIITLAIILLVALFFFWGIVIYIDTYKPIEYPGKGVYDLTSYFPCSVEGQTTENSIDLIEFEFYTNSTEITIKNEAECDITVYLYDTCNKERRAIGIFTLEPAKRNTFTNLTAATTYYIGVEPTDKEYAITITD